MFSLAATIGACANSEGPAAPTIAQGQSVSNPYSCDGLNLSDASINSLGRFVVDGGMAGCLAQGQSCALKATWVCDAGDGFALCEAYFWQFSCAGAADGAAHVDTGLEAAADGAGEADSAPTLPSDAGSG